MRDAKVAANLHPLFVKTQMPANSKQGLGPDGTSKKQTKPNSSTAGTLKGHKKDLNMRG